MTNKYTIDFAKNNTVSNKLMRIVRILQLIEPLSKSYNHSRNEIRPDIWNEIVELQQELDDPSAVVSVLATVESKRAE